MPWVDKETCVGCGVCVEECPVGAMRLIDDKADIDDEECIRCGRCHDVCPEEAVRHDSEKVPQMIEANMEYVRRLLDKFDSRQQKVGLTERLRKHFNMHKKIAVQTLEKLEALKQDL